MAKSRGLTNLTTIIIISSITFSLTHAEDNSSENSTYNNLQKDELQEAIDEEDYALFKIDDNLDYNEDCIHAIKMAREQGWTQFIKVRNQNKEDIVEVSSFFQSIFKYLIRSQTELIEYKFTSNPLLTCLNQDDELIQMALEEYKEIKPPSQEEYNLEKPIKKARTQTKVAAEVDEIVYDGKKKGGFFIEAGAHNFESDSDSLLLESAHGWTGLLVEPDPRYFAKGLEKNRKAYAINTCLSTVPRPSLMKFNLDIHSFMNTSKESPTVMCYPLYSILVAMGNPTVDYFSLDVEGAEFPILKTIPWDKVDIRALSIETHFAGFHFPGSRQDIIDYMKEKGYKHIPYGHEVTAIVHWAQWTNSSFDLKNDLFVKEEMKVKSEEEVTQWRLKNNSQKCPNFDPFKKLQMLKDNQKKICT